MTVLVLEPRYLDGDGYIQSISTTYATARSGGTMAKSATATSLYLGQRKVGSEYRCYETLIGFDTSVIPPDSVIESAVMRVAISTDGSTTDFTLEAREFDYQRAPETADWVAGASLASHTLLASKTTAGLSGELVLDSEAAMLTAVNFYGSTGFVITSDNMRTDTAPTGDEYLIVPSSESTSPDDPPTLTITYTEAELVFGDTSAVLTTADEATYVRAQIAVEADPIYGAWVALRDGTPLATAMAFTPGAGNTNYTRASNICAALDAASRAAREAATAYMCTLDDDYAQKTRDILAYWVTYGEPPDYPTTTEWNYGFHMSWDGYSFAFAYDLTKGSGAYSAGDHSNLKAWFVAWAQCMKTYAVHTVAMDGYAFSGLEADQLYEWTVNPLALKNNVYDRYVSQDNCGGIVHAWYAAVCVTGLESHKTDYLYNDLFPINVPNMVQCATSPRNDGDGVAGHENPVPAQQIWKNSSYYGGGGCLSYMSFNAKWYTMIYKMAENEGRDEEDMRTGLAATWDYLARYARPDPETPPQGVNDAYDVKLLTARMQLAAGIINHAKSKNAVGSYADYDLQEIQSAGYTLLTAPSRFTQQGHSKSFLWTNSYLSEISGDLATIKASHIDVIYACLMGQVVCPGRPIPASDAEMTAYLDALDAAGLKAMLDVQGFGKYVVSSRASKVLTAGELAALAAYVDKWKDHPAVWGWYADDEGCAEYPVATRQQVYDTIKDHHPAGQVLECHNWLDPKFYSPAVHDVYALDIYAYFYDTDPRGCISESTGLVTSEVKEANALSGFAANLANRKAILDAAGETNYFACMQAFAHGPTTGPFAMPPADGGISRLWTKVQETGCDAYGAGWFLWKSNDAATMPGGVGEQLVGVGDNDHGFNYSAQRAEISDIAAVVAGYEPPADVLTVKTHTIAISGAGTGVTTVTGGGRVTSDGGQTVTARGVCWNITGAPTTADSKTTESGTTGGYASVLTDLLPNTMYHVRAYATNSAGTSYGAEIDFSYLGPVKPTLSLPTYSVRIGGEDITELVDLDTLHRSMSERGEASATIDIPVASENELPSNLFVRDAAVEIVVDAAVEWLGHVVAVHKPQPQDLSYTLDCAGGWDTLHHRAPYCKGFVEARYEEVVQVSAAAAAHLGLLPSAAATMDTDGQLLLMIPKGGDVKTEQGIAAGYWLFGGMAPDSHISRVTFDWVTGGDTASMYCVAGLQEGLYDYSSAFSFFFENLQPPGSGSADFDVDVEFNYTYKPRALVFMVQDYYDVTPTADTFLQIRNLRIYIDRTTAPRVDEIVAAIDAEVRPGAPAASTGAIGAPLTAFMLDPFMTPAEGIAVALTKAAVPPLCGIIQNQLHIANRPTAPPNATRLWTVSEQLTPGLEWGVEVDEEQSVDYVSVAYNVIGDALLPDGTPQIAYYPSAPPNAAARTGLIDGGDLTAGEAAAAAAQAYAYLHALASGPVTIPYVVQDANGNERPADVIRAWDWVQNVGLLDAELAGPFLVSEVEHQGHIATLTIGAAEAYAYNGPERMPVKGRYVGAHRVRTRTTTRVSFAKYWAWKYRKRKKKPKMPRHHARYGTIRGWKWTDVEGTYT